MPLIPLRLRRLFDWIFVAVLILTIGVPLLLSGNIVWFLENSLVENAQVVYLIGGAALYAWLGRKSRGPLRLQCDGLAIVMFAGALRESDPRGSPLEPLLGGIWHHGYHFLPLFAAMIYWLWEARGQYLATTRHMLRWAITMPAMLVWLGAAIFVASDFAEHQAVVGNGLNFEIVEESLEIVAYYCLVLSAWLTARRMTGAEASV